jgi:hypothetical protein
MILDGNHFYVDDEEVIGPTFLSLTERVEEDGETTSQLWLPDEVRQSCDLFKHAERAFLGTGTPIISSATIKDAACLGIRPDEKLFL